ncbi:hypersensitive-induced response protein 2-like [Argentina anserina]|uniref:hypersensitive-induced response protein 2-like n=1 Tax=Argentina anserina TaxID=57926 RepID=UPI0021766292|nr:hypersensitive-induced response protein 2-like [Potentilla anserina]
MGQVIGCVRVKQSMVAVREHCGKFDGVLQPGTHCVPWCFGYAVAGQVSLRVQQLLFKCEAKTKDNVFVNVSTYVHFRPSPEHVEDAFYKLKNKTHQMQAYVYNVIHGSVSKLELDALYEEKHGIAKAVQEDLNKAMSAYGYEIIETLIVDIVPDESLKKVMNENAAAKEKLGTACQCKANEEGLKP